MTRAIGIVAILVAAALAGCIENMSDLKDRLQGSNTDILPNDTLNDTLNTTDPKISGGLGPVARIAIYETGSAKLFEADFVAADVEWKDTMLPGGKQLSFTASASDAGNATIASYDWNFGDGTMGKGSTATHTYTADGGVFTIVLKVTDSKGRFDTQTVKVAVMPAAVVVSDAQEGSIDSPVGLPDPAPVTNTASVPFAIVAQLDGKDVKHVTTTLTLTGGNQQALNLDLRVVDSAGEEVARSTGSGASETIVLTGLEADDLTAIISLETGVQAAWKLTIETTYQPVNHDVEAYAGGDGHGHAH